jgi:dTMP kinase
MSKKKVFIVFEGIEGSGKTLHSKKLFQNLKKNNIPAIRIREPGSSAKSEKIRKLILNEKNNNFHPLTDTLLYLSARNENIQSNFKKFYRKKIIICDRFSDSTIAYQHYGMGIKKKIISLVNKEIIEKYKPDFTFLMVVNVNKIRSRLNKRKKLNRYDKFNLNFYKKVQKGFVKIAKNNKSKYMIVNSNNDFKDNHNLVKEKIRKLISQ